MRLRRCWGASCFIAPCLPIVGGLTGAPQAFSLSARPAARMTLAALWSRSWTAPARRACPLPDLQREFVEPVPACRARLARRQPPRHRVHGAPVAVGLLADDPHELAPPRIADRPCQPAVLDHPHDVEVLDVDHLVLANQRQSLLVVIVPPSPRHLVVRDRDLAPRLVPVGLILSAGGTSPAPTAAACAACGARCFGFATSARAPSVAAIVASRAIPTSTPASRSTTGSGDGRRRRRRNWRSSGRRVRG